MVENVFVHVCKQDMYALPRLFVYRMDLQIL